MMMENIMMKWYSIYWSDSMFSKKWEKLFGNCIKKTLPNKLQKSVTSHQRTKTTAHVTAPIWLRKVFDDIGNNSWSQLIAFGDDETGPNQVDDNFDFIDD